MLTLCTLPGLVKVNLFICTTVHLHSTCAKSTLTILYLKLT